MEVCIFHILWYAMSTPFLTRQSPLPTTLNQRPIVPMIYTTVPFQQYGGCWEKMKMKDTQTETEPQQAENVNEEQDMNSEENRDDVGRVTGVATNMFKLSVCMTWFMVKP